MASTTPQWNPPMLCHRSLAHSDAFNNRTKNRTIENGTICGGQRTLIPLWALHSFLGSGVVKIFVKTSCNGTLRFSYSFDVRFEVPIKHKKYFQSFHFSLPSFPSLPLLCHFLQICFAVSCSFPTTVQDVESASPVSSVVCSQGCHQRRA